MRYFITGATGFIGTHLCEHLVARGDVVVALVRTPAKAARLPDGVEVVRGDLSLFADPATTLPEVDVVVHLAGVVAADHPEQYLAINRDAVGDLIACLVRQPWTPRRMLFASSLAAAGPSPTDTPWTERDALAPVEPYGAAKAAAEDLVRDAPFPSTTFRPPIVIGPRDPATLTLFRAARGGLGVRVAGAPQQLSWVDVRDAVAGIIAMAEDPREADATYYLSHPDRTDVSALWTALGHAVGRRVTVLPLPSWALYAAMRVAVAGSGVLGLRNQLDDKQYRQMTAPAFVCSSAALRQELAWKPEHGLEEATTHAAEAYRKAGLLRP